MPGVAPPEGVTNYFIYRPKHGPAIAFAVLFAISGLGHIWQNNLKYKSYRIGFLLPWAAFLFVAGFILREYGSYHTNNLPIFISSQVLLFVAPPVYNGANYFIAGRLFYYLPYHSPIHPGRVWVTFVTLDAFADVIAANGAVRAANAGATDAEKEAGLALVKISLFLLIGLFLAFIFLQVQFHRRAAQTKMMTYNVTVIMYELYLSNFLILLRNCFRTAAFFYPWNSTANGKEWPVWVFEFVPMVINTYLMNVYPPAKYLPANQKIYLAVDGVTEIEGPGLIDKRPFWLTLIDPFDIKGIVTKKDNKNRYWLTDGVGGPQPRSQSDATEPTATPELTTGPSKAIA